MYSVPPTTIDHRVSVSSTWVLGKITWYALKTGSKSGLLLGALYGTFFFPLIGTIVGGMIGLVAGAVLGLINGLSLGGVTQAWFLPDTALERYRRVMTLVTCGTNFIAGVCLNLLVCLNQNTPWQTHNLLEMALSDGPRTFILIPTLIATLAPLFWRNRYIRWYATNI